jgi:hypothetical protein
VTLKTFEHLLAVSFGPFFVALMPLTGNELKSIAASGTAFFALLFARVNTLSYLFWPSRFPLLLIMRLQDTTQSERFLFAKKPIAESPVARAVRVNEQKHVAAVSKFIRFFIRFSCGF